MTLKPPERKKNRPIGPKLRLKKKKKKKKKNEKNQ